VRYTDWHIMTFDIRKSCEHKSIDHSVHITGYDGMVEL